MHESNNLDLDLNLCKKYGVDYLHLDIMDGRFVPRYGLYPEILTSLKRYCDVPCDIHLMVDDIEFAVDQFLPSLNVKYVSFHVDDNVGNIFRLVDKIKSYDVGVGIVVNLSSDINYIIQLLQVHSFESIMFMGINPGVLDQIHRPNIVLNNISEIKSKVTLPHFVQCDGAVNFTTIPSLLSEGINNLICGSSTLFNAINFNTDASTRENKFAQNYNKVLELIH